MKHALVKNAQAAAAVVVDTAEAVEVVVAAAAVAADTIAVVVAAVAAVAEAAAVTHVKLDFRGAACESVPLLFWC